ncbi:MAG: hypothetical protein WB384_15980 [Candidatus Sulfotelmatobacter sp.]
MSSLGRAPNVFDNDEPTLDGDPRWAVAQRTVRSQTFSRAAQLRAILLFVVRHAIIHPEEPIPEFEIGFRVLGRRKDFNPLDDNIVRVQMGHLRKKLEQYFSTEGSEEEVVIFIPQGSYKPSFPNRAEFPSHVRPVQEVFPSPAQNPFSAESYPAALPTAGSPRHENAPNQASIRSALLAGRWIAAILIFLALAIYCGVLWLQNRSLQHSLDTFNQPLAAMKDKPTVVAFWSNFLASRQLTDIVTGDVGFSICQRLSGKVFALEDYITRDYAQQLQTPGMSSDLHNGLVVVSRLDITSSSEFNVMRRILALDPQGRRIHYYKARNFNADLFARDSVVLLGNGLSNPWEQPFRDQMNFVANADQFYNVTNRNPAPGEERVYVSSLDTKFGVVAYLPLPDHQGKVLILDGTGAESVEADGDFLLSESRLSSFQKLLHVNKLPYFEVLLKINLVRGTPLDSTIVAYRTYPNLR